jgi:ribosome-associated toxin RatA of RatAB toxin-antitoxin module
MQFYCDPIELAYLDTAPYRIENQVIVKASPERVFELFEDGNSWVQWVDAIDRVEWTSPQPFGVGTTRTVRLKALTVYEKFIAWDRGKQLSFYFSSTSLPFARAFGEDYQLEPIDNGNTKITHIVGFEPHFLLKVIGPTLKRSMCTTFQTALQSLANILQK